MKMVEGKEKLQLIFGIIAIITLAIISIVLFNETSLRLLGIAIVLLAILVKVFIINKIYK